MLPSLLLTKIIEEFCDLLYPLGNNFYELSILPVLLNLLLDLRTHFKASTRKKFNLFSSEDSRMWKINSTGLNNQRKIFSFETHEHFNIGSKLLWEKQTWPPKLIFYALVEERLSIWSSGPSVHLIGKSLCLKLHVYTRYYCIHETLSLNLFSCPLIRLCHSALNLNLTLFINFHSFKNHFVYRRVRYLVVSRISRFFISATCGVCLLNVFSISDFLWCKTSVR